MKFYELMKNATEEVGMSLSNEQYDKFMKYMSLIQEWNEKVSKSLKGKPKSESHKEALRKPKPKYKWLLPDGTIKIMDASNGSRHKDWIRLEKIE